MKNDILNFFGFRNIILQTLLELLSNLMTTDSFIFGLARLTRISNPSTDSKTSLKVMTYCKFSRKTKLKENVFTYCEKEVSNFFQGWDHSDH